MNDLENVFLYDIDDLQTVVIANKEGREEEARGARRIVEEELGNFLRRRQTEALSRTFAAIRMEAETHRQGELARTLPRLAGLGEREREAIDAMTRALVNKLLHRPFASLRAMAAEELDEGSLALVRRLFGVESRRDEAESSDPGA